ncbi:molybdenum ABC transporter ATP-binding protein [Coraliomargarita sp. W4R72]
MIVDVKKKLGDFQLDVAFEGAKLGITALYGPSGSGKSSVVQIVAGLLRPDRGNVRLNGVCLFSSEDKINLPPEKRRIGYVFQDSRLLPHYSVESNLNYGRKLVHETERFIDFDSVVELLGIAHLLKRRPYDLSGGEKQRVAIGRALLLSPSILLMDEPLTSLDPARKRELLPFIRQICDTFKVPILYVSHAPAEIREIADAVVVLRDGQVLEHGCVDEVSYA